MIQNRYLRQILSAAAAAGLGFLFLNLTFLLDAVFQLLLNWALTGVRLENLAPARHIIFFVLMLFLSWLLLKSRLGTVFKAAFLMVPAAVLLVAAGMFLNPWPAVMYAVCAVLYAGFIYFFIRRKAPWLYFFTVTLTAAALLAMAVFHVDI